MANRKRVQETPTKSKEGSPLADLMQATPEKPPAAGPDHQTLAKLPVITVHKCITNDNPPEVQAHCEGGVQR